MSEHKFERGHELPTAVLDVHETAAYVGVSAQVVYRLAREGELPHVRVGRSVRFRLQDLDRYLAERTSTRWTPRPRQGGRTRAQEVRVPKEALEDPN